MVAVLNNSAGALAEHSVSNLKNWHGSNRPDVFDLNMGRARPQHRDRVFAGGGRDVVFMRADGLRDVVRCGSGRDLVMYLDRREPSDRYVGCETIVPYSP
jgi:hypothetical protein